MLRICPINSGAAQKSIVNAFVSFVPLQSKPESLERAAGVVIWGFKSHVRAAVERVDGGRGWERPAVSPPPRHQEQSIYTCRRWPNRRAIRAQMTFTRATPHPRVKSAATDARCCVRVRVVTNFFYLLWLHTHTYEDKYLYAVVFPTKHERLKRLCFVVLSFNYVRVFAQRWILI